jgi:hypothetical protein
MRACDIEAYQYANQLANIVPIRTICRHSPTNTPARRYTASYAGDPGS